MPDIISEIVAEDQKARKRVQEAQDEKNQLTIKLRAQRASIEAMHQKNAEEYVSKFKKEQDDKLAEEKKRFDESYTKSLKSLIVQYEACKEPWIQSIYKNCIQL